MAIRIALVLAVWTAIAVPLALLVGRALAAAAPSVADEVDTFLRGRARGRRRRGAPLTAEPPAP